VSRDRRASADKQTACAIASDKTSVICRALRRAIIEQALRPGANLLPEDALGERFGVSRTIARHALGQLGAEGLVELRRNRIAVVATPSMAGGARHVRYPHRTGKPCGAALAGKLTKKQIEQLREHVEAEQAARQGSEAMSIRLATEFHVLLAEMTGKPILTRYVNEVSYRCGLTLSAFGRPHSSECAVNEHSVLIDALAKGDREEATRLMRDHLEQVADRALLIAPEARNRELMDILAPYAEEAASKPKRLRNA
jgi:DNA-binding GntR family transcriptional regulator